MRFTLENFAFLQKFSHKSKSNNKSNVYNNEERRKNL